MMCVICAWLDVNITVQDDLYDQAKRAGLNVSHSLSVPSLLN